MIVLCSPRGWPLNRTPMVPATSTTTTYATGSNGNSAVAIRAREGLLDRRPLCRNHTTQQPKIETRHRQGNDTTIKALIHAAELFNDPGASKNIGESAAPRSPGSSSTPQITVIRMTNVGRCSLPPFTSTRREPTFVLFFELANDPVDVAGMFG
jgi:hypothetical protein